MEIPGGHLDARKSAPRAASHEAVEEVGPEIYPELSYYAFYWTQNRNNLILPTDPEEPQRGIFIAERLAKLVHGKQMKVEEHDIVIDGVDAYMRSSGSDRRLEYYVPAHA